MTLSDGDLRRHCERRMGALDRERQSWFQHRRELSDHILPRRGQFLSAAGQSVCEPIMTMMPGASVAQTALGVARQAQQASRAWQAAYQTAQARNAATGRHEGAAISWNHRIQAANEASQADFYANPAVMPLRNYDPGLGIAKSLLGGTTDLPGIAVKRGVLK